MDFRPPFTRALGRDIPRVRVSWLRFAVVAAVILAGVWLGRFALHNDIVRALVIRYGYGGVFVVALVSGFNLLVPIPAFAFVPLFVASGLDFAVVVALIVAGVTLADMIGFFLGRAGRDLDMVRHAKIVRRLEKFRARHRLAPLVLMALYGAFAPLPNQVMAVPLGLMGYASYEVIGPIFIGNVVFNGLAASGIRFLFMRL
ncbi:MAG: hypothetical protein RL272_1192 [Candidatus Parcubacteria bacterium]